MKKLLSFIQGKRLMHCLFFLVVCYSSASYSQSNRFSQDHIDNCIREVFQDNADELVFNSSSVRYQFMSDFVKNQVVVEYRPEYAGKGFESTNDLQLNNKYNSNLQKDNLYNKNTFNPLKYQLPMNPLRREIFRIANTDYILIINPKK